MLDEQIKTIFKDFVSDISGISDLKQLEEIRIKYLSRNGLVANLFENLKNASKEEKPSLRKKLKFTS